MSGFDLAVDWLVRSRSKLVIAVEVVAGAILLADVGVVLVQVLDRFIFSVGFPWPEELSRYLLIWMSFLAAVLGVVQNAHYVVDMFCRVAFGRLGQTVILGVFANALCCLVAAVLFIEAMDLVERIAFQQAPALEISMSWVFAALPVSLGLITVFYAVEILSAIVSYRRREDIVGPSRIGV